MAKDNESTKWLYEQLSQRGYNVGKDAAEFDNLMRTNASSREWAYKTAKSNGLDVGRDQSEFDNLVAPKEAPRQQSNVPEPTTEQPARPTERQTQRQTQKTWKPTPAQKFALNMQVEQFKRDAAQRTREFNERMDNLQEYGRSFAGGHTASGGLRFNPQSKKMERTYLTPTGDRTFNKAAADAVSKEYRDAVDMTVGGQIRRAQNRLQELKDKAAARVQELHDKWKQDYENNDAPLAAVLAADTYVPSIQSDQTYRALQAAIRQTEEQIKTLGEQQDRENGEDVGFWRGFGRVAGDLRTWDFGIGDMMDAMTMMNAANPQHPQTEQEKAANQDMMRAIHENQQTEAMYGGNASFWNRAGMMTGYMPSFMLDFVMTGGGFDAINVAGKATTKLATKTLGKEAVEQMAKQGFKTYVKNNGLKGFAQEAGNWTIKALGTTADELLIRAPLMTNTVQGMDTASDIIQRKLGDVQVDENGNYDFTNDKTWGSAVWQGEANSIVENYSEMFGTHLPEFASAKNLGRLANVIGAKRLSGVLSRANAGALGNITDGTRRIFEKMGVSDYLGEVSEEYYGQLWRTMLNLDDAYQQNPDGTRTNLFATKQFHGDIWGGMALSMGLMGAGKATMSAANYISMKHDVNKADARASELLTPDVWEPLRSTIDMATNDNVGDVAELIVKDNDLSNEEKAAVLNYMERSLYLRGANLAELVKSRGGEQDEHTQRANDSYMDGYNARSDEEMQDARNMYELQRQKAEQALTPEELDGIDNDPIGALQNLGDDEVTNRTVIDYINAKQVYDGMLQRVRDDIDGRIDQSNAMIDSRVNRTTGMIQGATMKVQDDEGNDRRVYVLNGNLAIYEDGTGIDKENSDDSIIIRDADTGKIEMVSPDAIFSVEQPVDPETEKQTAAEAIRQQFATEAANRIDGVVAFQPGDTYTLTNEDGQAAQIQIVANEDGLVDNGDGTVNVTTDGQNIARMRKEDIQAMVDATNRSRVAQAEMQRETMQQPQAQEQPTYNLNDEVALQDENGNEVRGSITADVNEDGQYEVYTESPINGRKVNLFTAEELDRLQANPAENSRQNDGISTENGGNLAENFQQEQTVQQPVQAEQPQQSALERIPKDEKGQPIYEQADPDTAWDAIVEQTEGDEAMAQNVADSMVADKEAELKKAEKAKPKGGTTIAEKIAAERERKNAVEQAKANLATWQRIAQTSQRRKQATLAEQSRQAEEAARLRREQEEKERAEREEAERIRREALNGVPDIIDDTPQNARARGYRRVNGEKVDRQVHLAARQGKEVQVKFDDKNIPTGHVALIEAGQLQPSHINGRRNPFHFIDEAQPKERNDEASVMSARRIAANIRPEEITSSVTAYTGAPTVNTRGEVIQGNNRSAALRDMWAGEPEQAALYKQYLTEHAADFGLAPEDVEAMQQPVLVNMVDVPDEEAISLGQFVAQDTESGGTERIKPKNIVQKMSGDMRTFASRLLSSPDEEMTFSELVDRNGMDVLKWMQQKAYITPTQYRSAFDSKDNLTAEAKNDLKGIMFQSIFQGGSTHLEEMFNAMPAKAQKAILATAYRDYDSPNTERLNTELQNSISAYYALSQMPDFANAKNYKEARMATEAWKRQLSFDDVTGESYLPSERYSNFALLLATMYKGQTQVFIQNTLKNIFDLVQGTQETTLFEEPDNTPRTLEEAINETLSNLSNELLLNENFTYNGQRRNNVLAGSSTAGQQGRQGSTRDDPSGGRTEGGTGITVDNRGTEDSNEQEEAERREAELASRVQVNDDDWQEGDGERPTYKRSIIIDGTHTATQIDEPDENGHYTGSYFEFDNKRFGDIAEIVDYIDNGNTLSTKIAQAEAETTLNPTEGQKEAGNYKKGHVRIGQFNITVENPKGSVRRGTDANGNPWETTMQNTYGYIRGTEGVDGDHIDVFLTNDIDGWNGRRVYVVDQYNEDGTFDEHKIMLGFNDEDDARNAYFANYSKDWADKHKIVMTSTNLEDFEKWIDSSHRKTKPFAEYKSVKTIDEKGNDADEDLKRQLSDFNVGDVVRDYYNQRLYRIKKHSSNGVSTIAELDADGNEVSTTTINAYNNPRYSLAETPRKQETSKPYSITSAQYTNKRGKVLDMFLVKFAEPLTKEQQRAAKELAKSERGWYERNKDGFMMRSEESAQKLANTVMGDEETVNDAQPLSLADMQQGSEPAMRQVDVEGLMQAINRDGEAKLSDHLIVGRPGLTQEIRPKQEASSQQPEQNHDEYGANNKLVSRDRYEELKKRMRQKLGGQLNMGIDPEILAIGTEMAAYHIEAGARKFADYARHMIDDLGDAIRPYLKSFYNGARDLPEVQEAGYAEEMTPYDEVRTFDTANFDKTQSNAMATAEMVVAEQEAQQEADTSKEQLINQRNEQRRKDDEQRTADTEAVAGQAEAVASKAESDIETATDEKQVNETVEEIDNQLDKINEQLALLGYYEADQVEGDFNEAYGYMRNAEKKAVKDANRLANRLVKDLGIDPKTIVDKKGKRRRSIATANVAPIGGDISIHLPLGDKRELYINIQLDKQDGDNLKVTGGYIRIENPNPERGEERYLSSNNLFAEDETYLSLLRTAQQLVKHYAPDFVPVNNAQPEALTKTERKQGKRQRKQEEPKIADLFSAFEEENRTESQANSPFQKGDAVIYQGKPATVYDIEDNGRLVLDTGLAPVLYESADPKEVKPANTITHNAENTEINRIFANEVKTDMLAALDNGTRPYRNILDLRKRAAALGMEVDNDGRTDILLQELVEDGLVRAAREVVNKHGRDSRESYDLICKLYEMQPTIAARSSNRIKMQQYSTPLPMAWNAARFAMSGKKDGKVLEPTAGNGMLVFAVPANQVHVNELDETRLDNLREQGFAQVTQQDAIEPFDGGQQYDVVIANPPFGKREAVNYDGKLIPGLDPQITLNALSSMKDDGKAAIIIGGNMEYGNNGGLKSMKPFFTYLYDHYNVKGVVDMDGKLYAKQGTTYPTRMILIDGRRSDEERAQTAVYPPVESKAIRRAESFDDLYEIVNEVINSKEKTNGTEILRSKQGQLVSVNNKPSRKTDGERHTEQPRKDDTGRRGNKPERGPKQSENVLRGEHRENTGNGETSSTFNGSEQGGSRRSNEPDVQRVGTERVSTNRVGLNTEQKKRTLTEEKLPYRPHNTAFSLNSVAPAAMVEAMDNILTQIEAENGSIDEYIRKELGYDTIEEAHQALAAEQMDSVAMAIYQMKKGQALIIGDQTGVGKGRQMAALIRWAVMRGEKPVFITQKADLFSDIYRDLVDIGSGDLVPFIFNSDGAMVDSNGNVVHKPLSSSQMAKVFASGQLPEDCDFAVLTYSQVNTGDEISQKELEEAAKKHGGRVKKSKASKNGKATPKATFLRSIAEDNYLFLDESHTAAGTSNTGAYLQSILRTAKAATFASATFAKRPDTMPLYAIRTAMSQAKVEPDKMISIIEKGGVTLQEIMSRELTNAGQMVRRERDMSDVKTDWKTIDDPATVKRARENYDRTIAAFNAIIKFQDDYVKPKIDELDRELAITAESAGVKKGTDKMGVENVPFASKTYNYTKQLMLALKVDAIADEVDAEIKAGRHPVIALESTMESTIKDYSAGDIIEEPTFSASLLKGLDTVMQYTVKDENGKETHAYYSPHQIGEAGEKAYYELQSFIRKSTSDIFISPLDAIIERLHEKGYKVGELTGRNTYVERNDKGQVVVKRRTDKDKKKMQREFNNGTLDVLILNKSASTGISLHASKKFSDQRQRTMIIAQPLSDINDYMQMIGRIDRTGQVHRGYYINLGLPVPAENRFLMMLSTKLKSLNANTTTSQDSKSNEVEAPDLLNKYGSQVVVEYLRDNPEIYEKMGCPLKKGGLGGGRVQTKELDEYKPQEDDARKITGYVALLTTKEQEEFYDDVVRRYNELIKYLDDTGSNDLKITVMPLRAKTLEKRISSEGIDPNGKNPFAQNAYVEKVEMDVLRKPMKADEIRKTVEQINGKHPETHLQSIIETIQKEHNDKIAAEEQRYENAKKKAVESIAKQTEKINRQQKRTADEKREAIATITQEINESVEERHDEALKRMNSNRDLLLGRLRMFSTSSSYLVPDNLETMMFDFAAPAIFCGYKAKDKKITASTTLAVFATLDGRRRIEVKLSDTPALQSIYKMTNDNWDAARSITLENWDSQIPTETRKQGYILTGNILQAIADTQDEHGGYPGQLISYTDIDGNIHDGILMPDKWNTSMLKSAGAPLSARMEQIKRYEPIVSLDGKVSLVGSEWAKMYYLTVPKTKKDGAIYYQNETLLNASNGLFYPYHGELRADIPAQNIEKVVRELTKLGVKVKESNDVVAGDMMRGGNGALTDDELSYENDPVAKMTGRSTRTAMQRRAFAKRERQRMMNAVQGLAEKLHLDNVDIVTDASALQGRRAKAKGFYSRGTGRITIVIPNHTSVYDVEQTLLHEAVTHYGLRQLFGEQFDTFLDNVFQNADENVRRHIVELAEKHGWDFRTATEEYLASLAENTNFENTDASWWQKIKELFLRMLHKIGFENFSGVTLSDNELRYILWRSYENLAEPGRYRSILDEAEDVAKQNELKVGNYAIMDGTSRNVAEGHDELYRDGDPEVHERTLARDRYEQRVKRGVYQMQEALQDSMLGLREAMEAILKGEGKKKVRIEDVDGFENAYLGENRLSSVNKAEADAFAHILFKPLLDEVGKLAPNKEAREELTDYMMAKHGLERNRVMREREKEKLVNASELAKSKPQQPSVDDDDYDLKMDAYDKAMEDWEKQVEEELGDKFEAIDKRDFAGLTALTEADNVADAEAEAAAMVDAYESEHDTEALWKRTNDVSGAILSKLYETGMMSKETYDNVRSMYEYYIPLRGFDEKTSDEAYAYLNSKNSAFTAPIKTAKGRKSKADDPLAYLQSMSESAITQGNRNKLVKQKFLNFVLNHPSDLASVNDIWLKYDKVADEWQPVFPDNINADDTPAEVERKMQDFEDKMKELAKQEPDLYKHGKDTVNIPYRVVEKRDLRQHQVVVKRGGRDYVITINGNPRAAQALNGQTNPDNDMSGAIGAILKAGERINRELSALYTTRNPDFVVSNFIRDMLYSNSMMWVKESPNYALRYHRNFAKVNPVRMKMLLAKYRNNKLDMNDDTERMFHQFMMNGGETGYANMRDIEKHKNDIRREIRKANGKLPIRRAWDLLTERLDEVNRGVENCARFAAFMTSREMGRTIDRSIYDAKEISVNFNKKGSGAKFMGATGQTKLGNASAFMSGLGRSGFVFWNAAIQGTTNFGRQAKRHPAKALTSVAVMFLLGAIVASLGYGDDDEDDKNSYWNLPEYVRRSNLLFRAGDQWISIPLPVEYRAVYGLGELMTSTLSGKEHFTGEELAGKIAGQVSQLLPLDFMEGGGGFKAFIPSSIKPFAEAYGYKKSWTGLPIYKDTPYNKEMPEWTKAYKSANKYLVDLSETLNEMSGGDQYTKGAVDFNPAQVEYVLNGYFGGIANTIDRMTKMGETFIGQREYDPKSFLVLNRILKNGDERTEYKAVNNEYFRLKEEHDKLRTRLRNYERDTDNGVFDYAEKIDFLYNSPEYARYEIFENYRPDIDGLYDMLKEANTYGDKEAVKDIEAQLNELKKMMISDMNNTRK